MKLLLLLRARYFANHWEKNGYQNQMVSVLMKIILTETHTADFNIKIDVTIEHYSFSS